MRQKIYSALLGLVALLGLALLVSPAEGATSVTLQPSSADSYIDEGTPTINNGSGNTVRVRSKTGSRQRTVVEFNLSSIPSDAAIKTGTLSLFMNQAPGSSRTLGAHRITGSVLWSETGVTWNSRDGSTNWTSVGGDFNAATSTTTTGTSSSVWLNWDIKADVQAWVDGSATNNGTLLKDANESSTDEQERFASKEDGTAANQPKLAVSYLRKVTGLTASAGNGQVSLSWALPGGSPDYNGTLIIRKAGSAPTSTPTDGTNYSAGATLPDGSVVVLNDTTLATSFTDTGLTNGTTYYYQAFARDSSAQYSLGSAVASAMPTACGAVADVSYVGASAQSGQATVYWSSSNLALILRKTAAFAGEAPVNENTYSVGATIGSATVVYNGSVVETSFTQSLTNGTTYYYKVFAKTATPCYAPGIEVNATPLAGTQPAWSYMLAGGSILKGGTAGSGAIYTSSNASRIISLGTTNGTESWQPVATTAAVQGWLGWIPSGAAGVVLGGDQGGKVYSVDASSGATNWQITLTGADAVQAPTATQIRSYSNATFQATYTGDVIFAATRNSSTTNNKLFAIRASDGSVLWTFNQTGAYSVDYIVGMPYVDYVRNRIYVASRAGASGTQSSLWVINTLDGTLAASFALGHLESSPTLSYDGNTLYVGNTAGDLYAINTATLALKWTSPSALGTAVTGFVWEDYTTVGRLYFSTADGNAWCLQDPGAGSPPNPASPCWRKAVPAPSTPLLLDKLYVGSSDGKLHQFILADGTEGTPFTVGDGTATVGDASSEDGNQIFVGTTAGKLYKISLPLP